MAKNGGKRENAGRPKGISTTTKIGLQLRARLVEGVRKRWKEIEQATFDLALGHFVEKEIDGERVMVYKRSPDGNTLRYLKDQTMGKAKETLELENPQENEQLKEINLKLKGMFVNAKPKGNTGKNTTQ